MTGLRAQRAIGSWGEPGETLPDTIGRLLRKCSPQARIVSVSHTWSDDQERFHVLLIVEEDD